MIRIRKAVRFLIVAVLLIALFAGWQTGTLCSVGYDAIAYICPLGALEAIFGSWAFVPRVLICLAVVVIVALVFGKAFCSWVCPVAPLSDLLRGKKAREKDECERTQAAHRVLERWSDTNAAQAEKHKPFRSRVDGRHVVLAGSLASAAVCGFPVFCLVSPHWFDVRERDCPVSPDRFQRACYRGAGVSRVAGARTYRASQMVPPFLSGRCVAIAAFPR